MEKTEIESLKETNEKLVSIIETLVAENETTVPEKHQDKPKHVYGQ
jgi:hypothetical protein